MAIIHDSNTIEVQTQDERACLALKERLLNEGWSSRDAGERCVEVYPDVDPAVHRWVRDLPLVQS